MTKYFLFAFAAALFLVRCQTESIENSEEINSLESWLMDASGPESNLAGQLFAQKALSETEADTAVQMIHRFLNKELKEKYAGQWQDSTLKTGNHELKFRYKKFGEKPAKGWSLYISMHGGGGTTKEMNDQQWRNQIGLYKPEEGIYMAPRSPTDSWNMWHQSHVDSLFSLFIKLADVFEDINTNRVYLTGYSAGGDGTYQLAPRMADQLAAAAMMAGHPNDASPLGLRNLPFALHMGAEDAAYDRNKIAAEWKEKLDELQQNDPAGYIHDVQIHEGLGHWMERKDTVAIEWMAQFNRNPYPGKVVWKQSSVIHNRFYWLGVPENEAVKDALVVANRDDQTITIEKAELVNTIFINLNDEIVDLNEKIKVKCNGEVIYNDIPKRTIAQIWKSLTERNDPKQVFSAKIEVTLN
jgi:predicted esterase